MSRPILARPLTLDPVIHRVAMTWTCSAHANGMARKCVERGCDRAVAEAIGVTRRSVQRWKHDGLSVLDADRVAAALDTHPAELWGGSVWNHAQLVHEDFLDGVCS